MNSVFKKLTSIAVVMSMSVPSYALPELREVVSGEASFGTQDGAMTVTQTSDRMIAEYNSFNIGTAESVIFNQPSVDSIALNRVVGVDPSEILGNLSANGRVFLVNPNGIMFGANARVDAPGFVASTLDISDEDFLDNNMFSFTGNGGHIANAGRIAAQPGGYVALLGSSIENTAL
jgi:filamentous hemagglutinin family protein